MSEESSTPRVSSSPSRLRWDATRALAVLLIVCTAMALWPLVTWLVREVAAREQIRQSFVLLAAAAALVAWEHAKEWRLRLDASNRALVLLGLCYTCIAAVWWLKFPLFALPAFALGLAGCLHIAVGREAWRFVKPLFAGFVACLVVILLFPVLDWPLRTMAGVNAGRILKEIGFAPELAVVQAGPTAPVKLILATGKNFFEVATECNGFGLITSGMVLALLAGGIAGRRGWAFWWLVPLAAGLGFAFNLLRILTICLLAPRFPGHYHALHETAGVIMLWSGLGLIGWIAWRPAMRDRAQTKPTAE